jgi:hypothetical protein
MAEGIGGSDGNNSSGDIKDAVREEAGRVGEQVQRATSAVSDRTREHVENVAAAVRSFENSVRGREDWLADAAATLGNELDHFAAVAREKDIKGLRAQLEMVARDRPVLFMGAAVALGAVVGRVLRSAEQPSDSNQQGMSNPQDISNQQGNSNQQQRGASSAKERWDD